MYKYNYKCIIKIRDITFISHEKNNCTNILPRLIFARRHTQRILPVCETPPGACVTLLGKIGPVREAG